MERPDYLKRLEALRRERQSWINHWRDLGSLILPRTPRWLVSDTNRGDKRHNNIYDNTAGLSARHLASGLVAGITSPARPWFKMATADPDLMNYGPVKDWLYTVQMRMLDVFSKCNLYNVLPLCYGDLGLFGTSGFLVKKDYQTTIRCYPLPIGSYMYAQSDRLKVDTCYREYTMTVGQLVQAFGKENCSERVQNWYTSNKVDMWVPVVVAIQPNPDHRPGSTRSKFMPFISATFERDGGENFGKMLEVMGYEDFPVMAPRWTTTGEDIYGSSPGMECLGTIRQLQHATKRKAQAHDKQINPPMVAPSSLRTQRASLLPGDITYIDTMPGGQGFGPAYQVTPDTSGTVADIQDMRREISRTFYEDLFLMLAQSDRRQITAREIDERHEEKLLMLGPVLERLHDELLDPLIDRTFNIMLREDLLPPVPDELKATQLNVDYVSIMAQAQKLVGTASVERFFSFAGNLASFDPAVRHRTNFDAGLQAYGDMVGVPPTILRTDEEVARLVQAEAQAQQMAQMQQMVETTKGGAEAAKLLAETPTNGRGTDLLSQLLGIGSVQ